MKKKILFLSLAMLLIAALVPTTAMAAPANIRHPKTTAFQAVAETYISAGGNVTITRQFGSLVYEKTVGEQLAGQVISSSNWPDFSNAQFVMDVVTNNAVLNMRTLDLSGIGSGTITVFGADGTSMIQGTFSCIIRGKFILDNAGFPLFYQVTDMATFDLSNGSGVFSGEKASGTAVIQLAPDYSLGTLAGQMTINGILR